MIKGFKSLFAGGLLGKILGLVREVLLASMFGTSAPVAAFRVAQTATFVPLNFFTADTLSVGFLPLHSRLRLTDARSAAVLYRCTSYIVLTLGVIMLLGLVAGGKFWVNILAPGYSNGLVEQTQAMLLVMAAAIPFYLSTVLASYLEVSNGIYKIASLRSTGQSLGLIAGTLLAFHFKIPTLLAWGFTGAYVVLAVWSYIRIRRAKLIVTMDRPNWLEATQISMALWRAVRPMLYVPFLLQGSIAIERAVTTLVSPGAAAALDYARLVTDTALVLVAAPLGLTALASFSGEKHDVVRSKVTKIALAIVVFGVPLSSWIGFHAHGIVVVLFARGAFDAGASETTSGFLAGLGFGLWAQILAYFLAKVLSSRRRNREAALSIACGSIVMIVFDVTTYSFLGTLGIGIGASLGALVQSIFCLLRLGMVRKVVHVFCLLLPGFAASVVCAPLFARANFMGAMLSAMVLGVFWFAYVLVIPKTRSIALEVALKLRE